MFNQENVQVAAAQKVMLEILCEIHRICIENNIRYWLYAGTLLGSIRHKGFIPWDDDCDIAMMRDDYEKFLRIAQQYLPDDMHLQTRDIEPEYHLPFAKIRKDNTILIETGENGKEKYHHGIFVDIFPCDGYASGLFIDWIRWTYLFRDKKKKYRKGTLKRALVTLYTNVVMGLPVWISVKIRDFLIEHPSLYRKGADAKYVTYAIECFSPFRMKSCDIFPVVLCSNIFEGGDFYLPKNSDALLRAQYGDDYMELPPVKSRKIHARLIQC